MILRILLPLLLLLFFPAWVLNRFLLKPRVGWFGRFLFFLPNLLLFIALCLMAVSERTTPDAAYRLTFVLTCTLTLGFSELLLSLFVLLRVPMRRLWVRRGLLAMGGVLSAVCFVSMVYGFTQGYRHVVVKPVAYKFAQLPKPFHGYRIAQISDFHLGTLSGRADLVKRIVDMVNAAHPDLVVFTGDLVNTRAEELEEFKNILSHFRAPDGVVSVMGNHDYLTYHAWPSDAARQENVNRLQELQRDMGWKLLLNEHKLLRRLGDSLAIVGVENDGRPPFPALGDLPQAQEGLSDECFKVLLSHDPSHWRRRVVPDTNIPLTLSGHTHGMQLQLGSFSPAAWFYPEWGGTYTAQGQVLHVSLGVGEVMLPFRLGAWPEINLITLECADV